MQPRSYGQNIRRRRRGNAIVELLVCLPLLVLITFGTIEACSMIYLQQSLEIAAYEGARVAIIQGTDEDNVIGQCQTVLDSRGIEGYTVTVDPDDFDDEPYGTYIEVSVAAECDPNSFLHGWFFGGNVLTANVEMMKETGDISDHVKPSYDWEDDDDDD